MNAAEKSTTKKPREKRGRKKMTVVALAKAMGVTPKTIRLLRREQDGPVENSVAKWKRYFIARASSSDQTMQVSDEFMPEELQRLRARLLRAQAGKEDAVRKLKEIELKRIQDNLVPMDDARKAIKKVLSPLRALLDQMPKAAGAKANPADPVHGEESIREHLEGIYQAMEKEFR